MIDKQPIHHAVGRFVGSPAGRATIALFLVVAFGFVFHADGSFHQGGTHRDMLRYISVFGLLACGMTLVIISGGIDLAVGSILALVAVSFSTMTIHWEWSPWVAVPLALAIGAVCGSVSGITTAYFRVQPFIATLAMMVFARGLAKRLSGGSPVDTSIKNPEDGSFTFADLPEFFETIDSRLFEGNLSRVTVIFLVAALVTWLFLSRHSWGRYLYAIGGNEQVAWLSGLPVRRVKILAYAASGVLAAIAGICNAAEMKQGDPEAGVAYELTAIAIVVIGGTNLMGGRGAIALTLIGTLTIGYLEKILSINSVPEADRLMLTGVIIVLAVLTQKRARL